MFGFQAPINRMNVGMIVIYPIWIGWRPTIKQHLYVVIIYSFYCTWTNQSRYFFIDNFQFHSFTKSDRWPRTKEVFRNGVRKCCRKVMCPGETFFIFCDTQNISLTSSTFDANIVTKTLTFSHDKSTPIRLVPIVWMNVWWRYICPIVMRWIESIEL